MHIDKIEELIEQARDNIREMGSSQRIAGEAVAKALFPVLRAAYYSDVKRDAAYVLEYVEDTEDQDLLSEFIWDMAGSSRWVIISLLSRVVCAVSDNADQADICGIECESSWQRAAFAYEADLSEAVEALQEERGWLIGY